MVKVNIFKKGRPIIFHDAQSEFIIVNNKMYINGNILDNWTYSISAGGDCDQGWEGAEAGDGHQCQPQVSFLQHLFTTCLPSFS